VTALLSATAAPPTTDAEHPDSRDRGDRPVVPVGYIAGFDGLRGIGLVVMLAYHHGIPAARGGIFTVSMFFTLSGFLIATLALAEWAATDRLSMRRFWERRARRLLPAAVAALAGVVVLQSLFEVGSGSRFRGDVLAALGYVANWRFASSGSDYGAMFATESPVQHFWSLAVEEQFYLTFPLLFVGLMALARGRWRWVGAAFGLGTVASFAAAWVSADRHGNGGMTYYATWSRASEVLVGVTLAFVVVLPGVRRFLDSPFGVRSARVGGLVGLVGLLWLWHTVGLHNTAVFRGGTALNAALTGLVILACRQAAPGPLARGLGVWPLRSLGKVSYGVYLIHWPLFLLLDVDRLHVHGYVLFAIRVGATLALAVLSYHLLEAPFRFGIRGRPGRLAVALAMPAAALVLLVVVVPVHRSQLIELPAQAATSEAGRSGPTAFKADVAGDAGPHPEAEVLLVGDSVSWTMWPGLLDWNETHPDRTIHADGVMALGCTLGRADTTRFLGDQTPPWPDCVRFRETLAETLESGRYDVVVVQMGHKDLGEREVAGEWRHLGDPVFDGWIAGEVASFADVVAAAEVPVLWASLTHVQARTADPGSDWRSYAENDPARVDRLNEIVSREIAGRPGFRTLDIGGWLRGQPGGDTDSDHRLDGIHWTFDGSGAVAAWVVPQILDAVSNDRVSRGDRTDRTYMGEPGGDQ
jgi:peptidoglycan/LPS O-acetylase OafA/YrhL